MPFAIDNTVVSGWYLENQATPYTEAIAQRLREDRAVVPALWELELTNVLRTSLPSPAHDGRKGATGAGPIGQAAHRSGPCWRAVA